MRLPLLLLVSAAATCPAVLVRSSVPIQPQVPDVVFRRLASRSLLQSCWGLKNAQSWRRAVDRAAETCERLTPNFDIDVGVVVVENGQGGRRPARPLRGGADQQNGLWPTTNGVLSNVLPPPSVSVSSAATPAESFLYAAWLNFLAYQNIVASRARNVATDGGTNSNPQVGGPLYPNRSGRSGGRRRRRPRQRQRRSSSSDNVAAASFPDELRDFEAEAAHNLGNLTCVLAKLRMLDASLQINVDYFLHEMWALMPEPPDPLFARKLKESFAACHALALSVPDPVRRVNDFGRHLVFFKCAKEAEREVCVKQEMSRMLEDSLGRWDGSVATRLGLARDAFDAAATFFAVREKAVDKQRKFLFDHLLGGGEYVL